MAPETATSRDEAPRLASAVAFAARAMLEVALPALLAGATLRYLVPQRAEAAGTPFARLADLAAAHGVGVGIILFVAFAAIGHYWAGHVPGLERPAVTPRGLRGTILAVVASLVAAIAAITLRSVVVGSYTVESASMLPTLEPGDLVLGDRRAYSRSGASADRRPSRGDIIVFDAPPGIGDGERLVKRVIGLPGDRIGMNGPHPTINGWEVPSCDAGPYLYPVGLNGVTGRLTVEFLDDRAYLTLDVPMADWEHTMDVKAGEVFVLGDNRANSSDSRFWNQGNGGSLPVPQIDARVRWWLGGQDRDGSLNMDDAFKPLELYPRLIGIDLAWQRDGIRHCLERRPANAHPPENHGA
jgi:signal peptidase I